MCLLEAHLDPYLGDLNCLLKDLQGVWNVWTLKQTKVLNEPFC